VGRGAGDQATRLPHRRIALTDREADPDVMAERIETESDGRRFEAANYEVHLRDGWSPPDLASQLEILLNPGRGGETLHWGRHYLYRSRLLLEEESLPVVVKQFRNDSLAARWRKSRGESKAARSWRAAGWLEAAGVPTPERLAWIESRRPTGPSWYICRYLPDRLEARYLIRSMNEGSAAETHPECSAEGFLRELGQLVRRMHDAGILFRDLSVGNILIGSTEAKEEPELAIVDLNRARRASTLPLWRRMRDLSRLNLRRPEHRLALVRAYCGEGNGSADRAGALLGFFQAAFEAKQSFKRRIRAPARWVKKLSPRTAHVHIPQAPEGVSTRDRIVWDALSDQPHQHASRLERLRIRLADSRVHARETVEALAALPGALRRYRKIRAGNGIGRPWSGLGVAVRPWEADPEALLGALDELGVRDVLVRLHPWQTDHSAEKELARELAAREYELTFALPQSRSLVLDTARWKDAIQELANDVRPYGKRFQLGQAINRSKWGVWNFAEFVELASTAAEILRADPGVELLGPGIIDFEPHAMAAALNMPGCPQFDIVTALLYVDRRGAPENRQLGFDAAGKAALMRAIGETAKSGSDRFWVTEVNWPLWEGPHSPAGRDVAVDEDTQANYLVRYAVELLAPGIAERVFWWQLIARGYGLVDPGEKGTLRCRPAWQALKTLSAILTGMEFDGRLDSVPDARLYRFRRGDRATLVGWSVKGTREIELPGRSEGVRDRAGRTLQGVSGNRVTLGPAPIYVELRPQ